MKYFFSGLVLVCTFMNEGIFSMNSNEFLNKMEGLCRLGQSIRSAEIINDFSKKSGDAEDAFEANVYREMAKILDNGPGYNGKECPTPVQLLSGKVEEGHDVFESILSILIKKEEKLASKVIKKVDMNVIEGILPKGCDVSQLSNAQRIAVAIIASQIKAGKFEVSHDYLIYVAINALVEEIKQGSNISENILKTVSNVIPSQFLDGLEIIK